LLQCGQGGNASQQLLQVLGCNVSWSFWLGPWSSSSPGNEQTIKANGTARNNGDKKGTGKKRLRQRQQKEKPIRSKLKNPQAKESKQYKIRERERQVDGVAQLFVYCRCCDKRQRQAMTLPTKVYIVG